MGYSTLTEQIQGVKQKLRSKKTKTLQVGLSTYKKWNNITEMGPFELTTKPEDYVFQDTIRLIEDDR